MRRTTCAAATRTACASGTRDKPTDKPRFQDVYGYDFNTLKVDTYKWLARQELILVPFMAGGYEYGYQALLVCPVTRLSLRLRCLSCRPSSAPRTFTTSSPVPSCMWLLPSVTLTSTASRCAYTTGWTTATRSLPTTCIPAPPPRRAFTAFCWTLASRRARVTAHASAAKIVTPYENEMVMMHEGASGGGKSELLQDVHRVPDGRVLLGTNLETGDRDYLHMSDTCTIYPVTDDMAICHPSFQTGSGKLALYDGEDGWFLRVDGITEYGSDPMYERITIHSKKPLVFFNIEGVPGSTCLVWEHTMDSTGKPCPNPRVIVPRKMVDNIVDKPVEVDVRSFGVRMPPSSAAHPDYGIMGLMHIIPPALAWLWRLVAPRGFKNPSISGNAPLASEGVGSYWPFATGLRVRQANLLLEQILACPNTKYVLIPNQHIGVYRIGFAAEWISREYLARRGGVNMKMERLAPAPCALLGYCMKEMKVDGQDIRSAFLHPETQEQLGMDGYEKGAQILYDFFAKELEAFDVEELHPVGKQILECFKKRGTIEDYCAITPLGLK